MKFRRVVSRREKMGIQALCYLVLFFVDAGTQELDNLTTFPQPTSVTAIEESTLPVTSTVTNDLSLTDLITGVTKPPSNSLECSVVTNLTIEEARLQDRTLYSLWVNGSLGPPTNVCIAIDSTTNQTACPQAMLCNTSIWNEEWEGLELCPYHNYILTAKLICNGVDIEESVNYTTRAGEPSIPTAAQLTNRNSTSLTFCWKSPAQPNGPIDGYRCNYSSHDTHDHTISEIIPPDTCHSIVGLQPWTKYNIWLSAFNYFAEQLMISGPALQAKFTTLESEPSFPRNLNISEVTNSSLKVAWDPPSPSNGLILNYTVRCRLREAKPNFRNTSETSLVLYNLKPFSVYSVAVRAWTKAGKGNWTSSVTATTDVGKPSVPTNVTFQDAAFRTILVSWNEPEEKNGPIDGYFVEYGTYPMMITEKISNALQFKVVGLSPWTIFIFKISAFNINKNNETVVSDDVKKEGRTPEELPGVVSKIEVISLTNTTVSIQWLPPQEENGIIIDYVLRYRNSGDWKNVTTEDTQFTLSNLDPYFYYDLQVAAQTSVGNGNFSETLRIRTDVGVPGAPKNLTMLDKSDAHFQISWEDPEVKAGPIDGYRIIWWEIDTMEIVGENICENVTRLKIEKLNPWTNYSISIKAFNINQNNKTLMGLNAIISNRTGIRAPQPPVITATSVQSSTSVWLEWKNEGLFPGPTVFSIQVWQNRNWCTNETEPYSRVFNQTDVAKSWKIGSFIVDELSPFTKYFFIVSAKNEAGYALSNKSVWVRTNPDVPSEPQDFHVDCSRSSTSVLLTWNSPEIRNGQISGYEIKYESESDSSVQVEVRVQPVTECHKVSHRMVLDGFHPEVNYDFSIKAKTQDVEQSGPETYFDGECILPAGVPPIPDNSSSPEVQDISQQEVILTLSSTIFSSEMGRIIYYSLIVALPGVIGLPCKGSVSDAKPLPVWAEFWNQASDIYQATPENWNPFNNDVYDPLNCHTTSELGENVLRCVVGWEKNCSAEKNQYCNGPLKPGKVYGMKLRGYTEGGFAETYPVFVTTEPVSHSLVLGLSIGLVVSSLIVMTVVGVYIQMKKHNKEFSFGQLMVLFRQSVERNSEPTVVLGCSSNGVPVEKVQRRSFDFASFLDHVVEMMSDSGLKFSLEFEDLKNNSPKPSASMAEMEENRSKNRWTNILPFDHSRVKLLPVDDEPGSDFINSSYIPGFYSHREYIASQGPLASTVDDFWRMIWEQKVSIIVMLTQCIERGKTKCEQYWPKSIGENMFYGDLMVQMTSENAFATYTVRTFMLKLGSRQRVVMQMHYTRWPDFGCPESPEELINFVISVRGQIPPMNSGPILVHCSAGVGRTGTFIAVDRLLLHVQYKNSLNVYKTVLEMREHRTNMVQTEDQYIYIHKCLRDIVKEKLNYS